MIRHVLKLVWNRKGANALIIVEILFSFLVVFAVVMAAAAALIAWNRPVGYEWRNVWAIRLSLPEVAQPDEATIARNRATMLQFVQEIERFPEVLAVGAANSQPFSGSTWENDFKVEGRKVQSTRDYVTDGYAAAMGIRVIRGRWFRPEDDAASYTPVVLDADLVRDVFGATDPIGKKFAPTEDVEYRVIGVVPSFRKDGEFSRSPMNMMFERVSLFQQKGRVPRNIVVKLRPGVPGTFEENLNQRLRALDPTISFRIRHMSAQRALSHRAYLMPALIVSVVALFLISMVTLGLSGVLWQNVTRRTREIGLRRALGASGRGVRHQVLAEVAMLATLAMTVGIIIVAQFPVLGIFRIVSPSAYTIGIVGALAMIYALTLLCGAYPGWLASRLRPAEALRYE